MPAVAFRGNEETDADGRSASCARPTVGLSDLCGERNRIVVPKGHAILASLVLSFAAGGTRIALASQGEMRRAGERYAENDVTATLEILNDIIRRKGKTVWMREALFLRAKIREKELGDRRAALRDLRHLTVQFAGTAASAFGQFRIARVYESSGLLADAYREYVLCSRLRGFAYRPSEVKRLSPGPEDVPGPRITAGGARELVALARERAAVLFGLVPGEAVRKMGLPPRTFVVAGDSKPLEIPADPARRSASGERTGVWYAVAPHGKSITGASVGFVAAVDRAAGGPQSKKSYRMVVEPIPRRPELRALVLFGTQRQPEKLAGRLRVEGGASALRISVYRSGARLLRCKVGVTVVNSPAAPPKAPEPPPGFTFAVPPKVRAGAGGVSIARAPDGSVLLAYCSPGPGAAEPDDDADLFLTRSRDGRTWQKPTRVAVSSAVDDRDPALAVMKDGRLLMVWTSYRRGPGASDILLSTSRDGVKWKAPSRLGVAPSDLEGMRVRLYTGAGVARSAAHVVFQRPEISIDAAGRTRVLFVAHGFRRELEQERSPAKLVATGLFGVVSTGLERWSKPIAIITTPQTHLNTFRPAPKGPGHEVVSGLARPAVIEREPGRSLVAWLSTRGRVFLSGRDPKGRWAHVDSLFAGKDASTAADGVRLLGPLEDKSYGVLVIRRDVGPRIFWRDRKKSRWRMYRLEVAIPPSGLADVTVLPLPGGRKWLTVWTAPAGAAPAGIYVREIAAPEEGQQKRK